MLELNVSRKNKIVLSDYDYQKDISNRLLMASFTTKDVEVLEEILYGSIKIPLVKLIKNLDISHDDLITILKKLSSTGLFTVDEEAIVVNKEMRKYYDYQILKFDPDFKPNMSYLQGLLRKVPIQVLPSWYSIPRSSNNIFASMVEKYFKTPQIYERYLLDLNLTDPVMAGMVSDIFNNPEGRIQAASLKKRYKLSDALFEEYILHLH